MDVVIFIIVIILSICLVWYIFNNMLKSVELNAAKNSTADAAVNL